MADTIVPAGDPAAVTLYADRTFAQAIQYTTATKLMTVGLSADDPSNFVQYFADTAEHSGDTVKYELIYNPFTPGIAGDNVIAGNETALTYDQDVVVINQLRTAILLKGMMSQQRVSFSLRDKAQNGSANWMRRMTNWGLMNQAAGNTGATRLPYIGSTGPDSGQFNFTGMQTPTEPSSDHAYFMAGAASESVVGTDPKYAFNVSAIPDLVAMAQGTLSTPIKPVVVNGLEIAGVLFLDHLQIKDMKKEFSAGEWGNLMGMAMQGGQVQGNPLFVGAYGIICNTLLHQDTYLPWGDGVVSNLIWNPQTRAMVASPNSLYSYSYATQFIGRGVFMGSQAISFAVGMADGTPEDPLWVKWVEEPLDADNQLRVTCGMIFGFHKSQFGGSDYAVITLSSYVSAN